MDVEFWASRVYSANNFSALQSASLKNSGLSYMCSKSRQDATGHFTTQHAHSVKMTRTQKLGLWINSSMVLVKDVKEMNSYLGADPPTGRSSMHENVGDPLLTPFLRSIPHSDPESNRDANIPCNAASVTTEVISTKSDLLDEAHTQDCKERKKRAAFSP